MTDVTVDPGLMSLYDKFMAQITEIDEQLEAGSESAGKRKFVNQFVENNKNVWETAAEGMVTQLQTLTPEQLVGTYHGVIRALTKNFKEIVEKYVNEQYESVPKESVEVLSDDQKKQLAEERRALAANVNKLIELIEAVSGTQLEKPKRRGAVGSRGRRALSSYNWSIDGEPVPQDSNSLKGVAVLLGFEKQAEFTKVLRGEPYEIDTTNPPVEFSVDVNGKVVTAAKVTSTSPEEEDIEDEDDDDDDDDDIEEDDE